jgi:DNA-directed RNA polymerase specialized sigma subunit
MQEGGHHDRSLQDVGRMMEVSIIEVSRMEVSIIEVSRMAP